jgi:hypothetical protein
MILPTKKLRTENALIYLGGIILGLLNEPKTVSRVWDEFQKLRVRDLKLQSCDVSFDWFILALDLLYTLGTVKFRQGRLEKSA